MVSSEYTYECDYASSYWKFRDKGLAPRQLRSKQAVARLMPPGFTILPVPSFTHRASSLTISIHHEG